MQITLRKATMDDAAALLTWRNDPETRRQSFNTDIVPLENHLTWLAGVITNPDRILFVAEHEGVPAGTIRADKDTDGSYEISWTVAPLMRGKGIGKAMLRAACETLEGNLTAQVKSENKASMSMAESVGFVLEKEQDDVLYYRLSRKIARLKS